MSDSLPRTRLGQILLSKDLINEKQLNIALIQQRVTGELIGEALVKLGFISSEERSRVLAEQAGTDFLDLDNYLIPEEALRAVPKEIAENMEFIPLEKENGRMTIGITKPGNILAIDTVARITGTQPRVYMVDVNSFFDTIEKVYFFLENPVQQEIDRIIQSVRAATSVGGADLVSATDILTMDGIKKSATDIHITPTEDVTQVFYRIDGVLQYGHCLPKILHNGIVSRIKILSQLDIAEQRVPQDGSFVFSFLNKDYDIRVSTNPTIYGENVVLRILSGKGALLRLDDLGFEQVNTGKIRKLFQKPFGVILITGPTGSGKTTTLYSALREVNLLERNVLTVEDPVEYRLPFAKQTQVHDKAGYDFALAGRTFMRQDPDVILLGEIRDEETARIAIRASITGHLVLTTLHTNDALTAIPRLIDLNTDRYLLSSSVLAIIAQRLVRKVCLNCKEEYPFDEGEKEILKEHGLAATSGVRGKGCVRCNGTGYLGRTAIGEILVVDDEIRELIYNGASVTTLKEASVRKGMILLKENGVEKACQGITTMEEVLRVAG